MAWSEVPDMAAERLFIVSVLVSTALALGAVLASAGGPDKLVVLGHDRGARPAESFIGELLGRFEDEQNPAPVSSTSQSRGLLEGAGLPSESRLVSSSTSADIRRIDIPLTSPLCVIGPDRESRRWLIANRRQLVRLGAGCVLVQASGKDTVDSLRRLADPVPVLSVPFDDLTRAYGIRTVPVLLFGKETGRK